MDRFDDRPTGVKFEKHRCDDKSKGACGHKGARLVEAAQKTMTSPRQLGISR